SSWFRECTSTPKFTRQTASSCLFPLIRSSLVNGLKSIGGPWKNLYLVATAEHIGVREARRIKGLYTVTSDDLINGKRHEDAVCRVNFGVDVHSLNQEEENSQNRSYSRGITSQPYDIPLRSLISKDIGNLMMAGRNISGDFISFSSYRVTGNAAKLGEEAGKHAAESILNNNKHMI
ncbi:MAG TPA: FAD-dependent oxidoreductase, partial [Bacteroides sp.]|nr:FAD-dependent oxidoreductase [Bacteroides sp.]